MFHIERAIHGTRIKVREEGTEAAGATAIILLGSDLGSNPKATVVNIDYPFVYTISEVSTGTILFMGEITNL